jgi:hypothetical protein
MKKDLLLLVLLFILALVPSINYMKKEQSNFKNIIEYSEKNPEYNIDTSKLEKSDNFSFVHGVLDNFIKLPYILLIIVIFFSLFEKEKKHKYKYTLVPFIYVLFVFIISLFYNFDLRFNFQFYNFVNLILILMTYIVNLILILMTYINVASIFYKLLKFKIFTTFITIMFFMVIDILMQTILGPVLVALTGINYFGNTLTTISVWYIGEEAGFIIPLVYSISLFLLSRKYA